MVLHRRRSADELQRVYREHVDAVYAFFAYSLGRAAAEDLTSATFERVVRSWANYDARRGRERSWIMAIAHHLLIDHHRRQSHRAAPSTDEHPELLARLATGDEPLERALQADELRSWLRTLGERERQIVALRYAGDLPAADIAELMNLTPANVHQILSRSLRRLREVAEAAGVRNSA